MKTRYFYDQDTIVAPATPPGEGGIGIVRLSGPGAEELMKRFFNPGRFYSRFDSHVLYYGHLHDGHGGEIDEVMAVIMRKPRSYTREDVVEVHCHGGAYLVKRILDLFVEGGARIALPGEFTLRAFLNGRIDLTQAEAVSDLIRARSDMASEVALEQLEGKLGKTIQQFGHRISDMLALVEAFVDFPEEDTGSEDFNVLCSGLTPLISEMDRIIHTFDTGRVLREGLNLLIFGKPNVGKSSLMNALMGEARAIVTDIPGTTRDTIEEDLVLAGLPLRVVDTAGIRHTEDPIEEEGVRRAQRKLASADLVLLVIDGSQPLDDDDLLAIACCCEKQVLVVLNKMDLGATSPHDRLGSFPYVRISAQDGKGVDGLVDTIGHILGKDSVLSDRRETAVLTDRRHKQALVGARNALERFRETLAQELSPEFGAIELREALGCLGEITGDTTPDDILEKIFTRFCIGK